MAKWKNALLISTIVAPIAFGAGPIGDALADAAKVTDRVTDVTIHKMLNKDATATQNQNYYWGNGEVPTGFGQTGKAYDSANWKQATGEGNYTFTAYALPGNVISGFSQTDKDKPTISTDKIITSAADIALYPNLENVTWDQILIPVKNPTSTFQDDDRKSSYTINLDQSNANVISDLKKYLEAEQEDVLTAAQKADDADQSTDAYDKKTDANGETTFQDLESNEWIIFETGNANGTTEAVPMVLNLPMMRMDGSKADPKTDAAWFGTRTDATGVTVGEPAINLYPKDYITAPELTVLKKDGQTGEPLKGVDFILFDKEGIDTTALKNALSSQTLYNQNDEDKWQVAPAGATDGKTIVSLSNAEVIALLGDVFGITGVKTGETGADGKYKFTGLELGHTYGVMETNIDASEAGDDYDEITGYREITLTDNDPADTLVDETDTQDAAEVWFTGSTYELKNMPSPDLEKNINVGALVDPTQQNPEWDVFAPNDYVTGVTRGEHFQYTVDTEYNNKLAAQVTATQPNGYSEFSVLDTFDHEIDITDFYIGSWVNGVYTPLIQADIYGTKTGSTDQTLLKTDGGHSGQYDGYAFTLKGLGDLAGYTDAQLKQYVEITGTPSKYTVTDGKVTVGTPDKSTINVSFLKQGQDIDLHSNIVAQELVKDLAVSGTATPDAAPDMRLLMNAQLNSSATVGQVNNNAEATVKPTNGTPTTPEDDSKTYDAGWEFVKTDDANQPLQDAQFIFVS